MAKIKLCAFADEVSPELDLQIKAMQENGIPYLEIRGTEYGGVGDLTASQAKEIRKRLDDGGIEVWSLGSPAGKSPITEDFSVEAEKFKRLLETAHILSARCIRLFSFYGTEGKPEYRDEVLMRLSRYVEMAQGSGVLLCHENEKAIYGENAERCAEIHRAIPQIKAVFDPANYVCCGVDTLKAWDLLEPYVYYGHIKDALASGQIVPPGKGIGHLPEYLPRFVKKGCSVLTLEPHLAEFVGLAGLEEEGSKSKVGELYSFNSSREAFDCAVNSLKNILKEIQAI